MQTGGFAYRKRLALTRAAVAILEKRIMLLHKTRPVEHKPSIGHLNSSSNDLMPNHARSPTTGARSMGALALGALAIGALAIGVLAIRRLVIGRARIRRLEIDELVVGRLHVTDTVETPRSPRTESDKVP